MAKKGLSKEDLRKAMKDAKNKMGSIKRIESPLANYKYNESGQIMCILCKTIVRSEATWPIHINSNAHKENIILAKKTKLENNSTDLSRNSLMAAPKTTSSVVFKRPSTSAPQSSQAKIARGILKNSQNKNLHNGPTSLPDDFFDETPLNKKAVIEDLNKKMGIVNQVNQTKEVMDEKEGLKDKELKKDVPLPEGFFDDPVKDAKARNVEYKDPMEEEWERYQKEIKEETAQSAEIIADDQEEATTERYIDDIDEQLKNYSRVMDLVHQKESLAKIQNPMKQEGSSDDDSDVGEFLDWRSKKSY